MLENVTAESCVAFAIETEALGAELYQGLAKKFAADGELRELFERLAREEAQHGEQIRTMGERLVPRFRERPISADEQAYVRAMSSWDVFSAPRGLARDLGAIQTRDEALRLALHLEKATLAYYHAVRDVVGPEEILDSLIAMERMHVVKVTALLVGAVLLRGLADSA